MFGKYYAICFEVIDDVYIEITAYFTSSDRPGKVNVVGFFRRHREGKIKRGFTLLTQVELTVN